MPELMNAIYYSSRSGYCASQDGDVMTFAAELLNIFIRTCYRCAIFLLPLSASCVKRSSRTSALK